MENNSAVIVYDPGFIAKIQELKKDMHAKYMEISKEITPKVDLSGNEIIKHRDDGYDYIIEEYMRKRLDYHFPGWSWLDGNIQFLGEWIISSGHLLIIDEYLLAFGIQPPVRRFFGSGADRIQFKKGQPHTAEYVVDIDKNVASANSKALKRAINRLTGIGDDVYKKRVDDEGYDNLEIAISSGNLSQSKAQQLFTEYTKKQRILPSKVLEILGVSSLTDISDYNNALEKIKGGHSL